MKKDKDVGFYIMLAFICIVIFFVSATVFPDGIEEDPNKAYVELRTINEHTYVTIEKGDEVSVCHDKNCICSKQRRKGKTLVTTLERFKTEAKNKLKTEDVLFYAWPSKSSPSKQIYGFICEKTQEGILYENGEWKPWQIPDKK